LLLVDDNFEVVIFEVWKSLLLAQALY
jgi:hypothetical protein